PLHFVQFWIDNIHQWELEKGRREMIGLSTTKDVQDAILKDAARAAVVDVIDIRYWYYQQDGKAYAPLGGQSLAPRQHERLWKPKRSSFEQVYRAVREYRDRYPDKAVIYSTEGVDNFGWAVFMGGGSLANVPKVKGAFFADAAKMRPIDVAGKPAGVLGLGGKDGMVLYSNAGGSVSVNPGAGEWKAQRIDARSGAYVGGAEKVRDGKLDMAGAGIWWIHK
ncbi:MAG TPA: DUF6298 domain-containing protein, partial [Puia sp.]